MRGCKGSLLDRDLDATFDDRLRGRLSKSSALIDVALAPNAAAAARLDFWFTGDGGDGDDLT